MYNIINMQNWTDGARLVTWVALLHLRFRLAMCVRVFVSVLIKILMIEGQGTHSPQPVWVCVQFSIDREQSYFCIMWLIPGPVLLIFPKLSPIKTINFQFVTLIWHDLNDKTWIILLSSVQLWSRALAITIVFFWGNTQFQSRH